MNAPLPYILISVAALLALALLAYTSIKSGRPRKLTLLAGLAFLFVLAGIIFGRDPWLGYSLMGVGLVLALIDIINKNRGPVG